MIFSFLYSFVAVDDLFDGISNVDLVSTVSVVLAMFITLYWANYWFLRQRSESKEKELFDEEEVQSGDQLENEKELAKIADAKRQSEKDESDSDSSVKVKLGADGLVGQMKTARLKKLEAELTFEQLEEERKIEREQLTAIYELLKKQEADLNMKEINQTELSAQLSLYR